MVVGTGRVPSSFYRSVCPLMTTVNCGKTADADAVLSSGSCGPNNDVLDWSPDSHTGWGDFFGGGG